VILTPRLSLRPLTVEDAGAMVPVLADPRLYTFIGGQPLELDALRERYRRLVAGHPERDRIQWHNWIVWRSDQAIGTMQATIVGSGARIAWVIGVPWQGQGFASEATRGLVDWLWAQGVTTIAASIHPGHLASQRVAERVGFLRTCELDGSEELWHLAGPT
jgi:RimJ/RimL family protein N-acetyltransferase